MSVNAWLRQLAVPHKRAAEFNHYTRKQPTTPLAYPKRGFHETPIPVEEFNMTTKNRLAIQWLVCGFFFALPASAQTYRIVYAFDSQNSLTAGSTIASDKVGNLYGASTYGGIDNCAQGPCGAIYKIDREGKETTLYEFKGPPDGANPMAGTQEWFQGKLPHLTRWPAPGCRGQSIHSVPHLEERQALSLLRLPNHKGRRGRGEQPAQTPGP
jgi:uncharacterized repeat protein (TIGR03803 family)